MTAEDHGSASTYVNYKCRCGPCKVAASQYHKAHKRQPPRDQLDALLAEAEAAAKAVTK